MKSSRHFKLLFIMMMFPVCMAPELKIFTFFKLFNQSMTLTMEQKIEGIEVHSCAPNQEQHNLISNKFCPHSYRKPFHCLAFGNHYLAACRNVSLFETGTHPVFDQVTKNMDALPCPKGTHQGKFYKSNEFGVECKADTPVSPATTVVTTPMATTDQESDIPVSHVTTTPMPTTGKEADIPVSHVITTPMPTTGKEDTDRSLKICLGTGAAAIVTIAVVIVCIKFRTRIQRMWCLGKSDKVNDSADQTKKVIDGLDYKLVPQADKKTEASADETGDHDIKEIEQPVKRTHNDFNSVQPTVDSEAVEPRASASLDDDSIHRDQTNLPPSSIDNQDCYTAEVIDDLMLGKSSVQQISKDSVDFDHAFLEDETRPKLEEHED